MFRPCSSLFVFCLTFVATTVMAAGELGADNDTSNYTSNYDSNIAELKAAYFFNALKFARWPEEHLAKDTPLQLLIVGSGPVCTIMREKLHGRIIQQHTINIKQLSIESLTTEPDHAATVLTQAHAIFFAQNTRRIYQQVLAKLDHKALTGSAIEGFAEDGGMIEIALNPEQNKLMFYINQTTVKAADIRISSQLMALSTLIGE